MSSTSDDDAAAAAAPLVSGSEQQHAHDIHTADPDALLDGRVHPETTTVVGRENGVHSERNMLETKQALISRGRLLLQSYQSHKNSDSTLSYAADPHFHSESCMLLSTSSAFQMQVSGQKASENGDQHRVMNGKNQQSIHGECNSGAADAMESGDTGKEIGSWSELINAQLQNTLLLDAMETQVQKLWGLVKEDVETEALSVPLCQSIHQLLQQKRVVEDAMVKFTSAIGPPVVLDGDTDESGDEEPVPMVEATKKTKKSQRWVSQLQIRELVEEETVELQKELEESKMFISDLKARVHAYKSESAQSSGKSQSSSDPVSSPPAVDGTGDNNNEHHDHYIAGAEREIRQLQNRLQEKDELLSSLRASLEHVVQDHGKLEQELKRSYVAIDQLGTERSQMEKAAADKRTLLNRAYCVKARQLDQVCNDIDLPPSWQQLTDENGILYFRQSDRACAPQLEDPRVALAVSRYSISEKSSVLSPRSANGWEDKDRRSSSGSQSRHDSVDLTGCEDIAVPPDDGCGHKIDDFATPLPEGWEMRASAAGSVFFVNRHTNVTTWKDPRERGEDQGVDLESLRVKIPFERKQVHGSHANTVTSYFPSGFPEEDGVQYFDVVFKERGPIGIHFQANMPDAGATVRRLLPGTAAIETGILRPYDRLIAVNQHPVDTASFRHVMILLQGGLRPLTLTFKRELNAQRRTSGSSTSARVERTQSSGFEADLDEEVVFDADVEGDTYGDRRRSSQDLLNRRHSSQDITGRQNQQSTETASSLHDDDSVADKIITNLFSFFWTPPEPVTGEVQTV